MPKKLFNHFLGVHSTQKLVKIIKTGYRWQKRRGLEKSIYETEGLPGLNQPEVIEQTKPEGPQVRSTSKRLDDLQYLCHTTPDKKQTTILKFRNRNEREN